MSNYLTWDEKIIKDFSDRSVDEMFDRGFVFTREGNGAMYQTRSVRVDLSRFDLTSENRRVLRKVENLELNIVGLPHPNYDWRIHKMGSDFYLKKFGEKIFSANKIKEMLTSESSNYNRLFEYKADSKTLGYCIVYENSDLIQYAYPFYELDSEISNLGIGMMTKAIVWAKEHGKKYAYLGSAQSPAAVYKTQFKGFEWFDGKEWSNNIDSLKSLLQTKNGSD